MSKKMYVHIKFIITAVQLFAWEACHLFWIHFSPIVIYCGIVNFKYYEQLSALLALSHKTQSSVTNN